MKGTQFDASNRWASLWPGNKSFSFEGVQTVVEHLGIFYRHLDNETKALFAAIRLPNIRKRRGTKASEWIFTRLLTELLERVSKVPFSAALSKFSCSAQTTPPTTSLFDNRVGAPNCHN